MTYDETLELVDLMRSLPEKELKRGYGRYLHLLEEEWSDLDD